MWKVNAAACAESNVRRVFGQRENMEPEEPIRAEVPQVYHPSTNKPMRQPTRDTPKHNPVGRARPYCVRDRIKSVQFQFHSSLLQLAQEGSDPKSQTKAQSFFEGMHRNWRLTL